MVDSLYRKSKIKELILKFLAKIILFLGKRCLWRCDTDILVFRKIYNLTYSS